MLDHALIAAQTSNSISTGDLLGAGVTIFCLVLIPMVVWLLKSLLSEAKRRTADSINLKSIADSNAEMKDSLKEYIVRNDAEMVHVKEQLAAIKAVLPRTNHRGGS